MDHMANYTDALRTTNRSDKMARPGQTTESQPKSSFMQLDLQNVPKSVTKVTFHQQCYRLVPELSPDDDEWLTKESNQKPNSVNEVNQSESKERSHPVINTSDNAKSIPANYHHQRRRRQLPEIPPGKKPLEKLWQLEMSRAKEDARSNVGVPISVEIDNLAQNPSSISKSNRGINQQSSNLRWTRKLSTNMLLEIETDPSNGKALSLKLVHDEDENENAPTKCHNKHLISPEMDEPLSYTPYYDQNFEVGTRSVEEYPVHGPGSNQLRRFLDYNAVNNSDSGVSSNLQSPVVSTSDSNDFSESSNKHSSSSVNRLDSLRPLQLPDATHRALYKFCARHSDEIDLEIGDAIYVYSEFEDQWCDGLNLRTGARGIFPSSLITDVEYSEFTIESNHLQPNEVFAHQDKGVPPISFRIKRERYLLEFLGSIEVNEAKGDEVLYEAISRVLHGAKPSNVGMDVPYQCVLEISDIGVRMMDDPRQCKPVKTAVNTKINRHDYFFSLIQITYCGYQLKENTYYFAFITRHPSNRDRFACHVFRGSDTTRDVAEAVGRAFQRFYNRFVEITLPIDTFYLDD